MAGTSRHVHTTRYGRGTSSYRSPELVRELIYNNKVDIWALGCIVYELIFLEKAFGSDMAVYDYYLNYTYSGKKIELSFDEVLCPSVTIQHALKTLLHSMLEVEYWKRPRAVQIFEGFETLFNLNRGSPSASS